MSNNDPIGTPRGLEPPPSLSTPTLDINSPGQRREPPPYQYLVVKSNANSQICAAILAAVMLEIKRLENRDGERPKGRRGEKYALLVALHTYLEGFHEAINQGDMTPRTLFTTPDPVRGKTLLFALEYRRHSFHKSPPKSAQILRHYDPVTMVREARNFLQSAAVSLARKAKRNGGNRDTNRHARKQKQLNDLIEALSDRARTESIMTLADLLKFRANPGCKCNLLQVLNEHRYGEENGPDKPVNNQRKHTKTYQKFIELFGVGEDPYLIVPVKQALASPPFGH